MRTPYNYILSVARQSGGHAVAPTKILPKIGLPMLSRIAPVRLDLLALGSLLALLLIGRGAGTG